MLTPRSTRWVAKLWRKNRRRLTRLLGAVPMARIARRRRDSAPAPGNRAPALPIARRRRLRESPVRLQWSVPISGSVSRIILWRISLSRMSLRASTQGVTYGSKVRKVRACTGGGFAAGTGRADGDPLLQGVFVRPGEDTDIRKPDQSLPAGHGRGADR